MEKFVVICILSVALSVLALVGAMIYGNIFGLMPNYSDGDRSGVVVKISKKGVLFKSWEGQVLLGGMTKGAEGTMVPTTWSFSIPAKEVGLANQLAEASNTGKRVTLSYHEFLIGPLTLSTPYVVTKVTLQP